MSREKGLLLMYERKRAGMKQIDLGAEVGCTGRWIHEIESGRKEPSEELMQKIERALATKQGVDSVDIFWGNSVKIGK